LRPAARGQDAAAAGLRRKRWVFRRIRLTLDAKRMPFAAPAMPTLPSLTITSVIDILLVAYLIYQFLMMVRGRRAAPILAGITLLAAVYLISVWMRLELLRTILATLAPYTAFALIVMFQSELRRWLARLGRTQFLGLGGRLQRREITQEILLAVAQMSQNSTGALIVIERDIGLRTFVESGVMLDAVVSRDLLLAIFEPGGALHDGAVIIQRDRIIAAACFLPLTMNPVMIEQLGTRHRAAIGITEEADCLSIIVSEETGRISIAAFGEIEFDVTLKRLEERLTSHARRRDDRRGVERSETQAATGSAEQSADPVRRV
jgi:diadenylate cyclase